MYASKGDECKNAGMDGWAERALEVLEGGVSSQHPSLAFLRKMDRVFASASSPPYARDSLSGPCPFPNKVIYYLLPVLPSLYLGGEAKTWRMQEMDCPQMTISVWTRPCLSPLSCGAFFLPRELRISASLPSFIFASCSYIFHLICSSDWVVMRTLKLFTCGEVRARRSTSHLCFLLLSPGEKRLFRDNERK